MVSALNGFGLAIGCVDITGAVFFELMIICILWRRNGIQTVVKSQTQLQQQQQQQEQLEKGYVTGFLGNRVSPWMLWIYLLLLNMWIVVSLLMVTGIILVRVV
ncbi:GH16546 [Drosophila grimshawi]|uniref:GH16546 n=1 Tax=Drosophila grimshawi TaxID=7222 RepID=B4J1K7_DROGR|nr:GH16546 [Drosophila grimshawi]